MAIGINNIQAILLGVAITRCHLQLKMSVVRKKMETPQRIATATTPAIALPECCKARQAT
jgi:hypothetical protein